MPLRTQGTSVEKMQSSPFFSGPWAESPEKPCMHPMTRYKESDRMYRP